MTAKKHHLIAALFVGIIGLFLIVLAGKPWLSKEDKILGKIMGAYAQQEQIGVVDSNTYRIPSSTSKYSSEPKILLLPEVYGIIDRVSYNSYIHYREVKAPQYTVREIDEAFLNNGIPSQGLSLRRTLIPNVDALNKYNEKYAIFIKSKKEGFDDTVYFYLDGEIYSSIIVRRYTKVPLDEPPLSVDKIRSINAVIPDLLQRYQCTFFEVDENSGEFSKRHYSLDESLVESELIHKTSLYVTFGENKYIERHDNLDFNRTGSFFYTILNRPKYTIIEIDNEFLANDKPFQGKALKQLIKTPAELEQYREKYAIVVEDSLCTMTDAECITFFYLDGNLYYSPNESYGDAPLFPMKKSPEE